MDYPNKTVQLEGFAEFEEQLIAFGESFRVDSIARQTVVKAALAAMAPVFAQLQVTAPYDPKGKGPIHLRDTVRLDARIPSSYDKKSNFVNETDAAIAVASVKKSAVSLANEFGTKRMAAQPFLRRALDSNINAVLDILKVELGSKIPEMAARLAKKRK